MFSNKKKYSILFGIFLSLFFFLIACSKTPEKVIDKPKEVDFQKIGTTIKDFQGEEVPLEKLKEMAVRNKDGSVVLKFESGDEYLFDENSDVIDATINNEWKDINEEEVPFPKRDYVDFIRDKYVPSEFDQEKQGYLTRSYLKYDFSKENPAKIFNPYMCVSIDFDNIRNAVIGYNIRKEFDITEPPKISEEEAIKIAEEVVSEDILERAKEETTAILDVEKSNNFLAHMPEYSKVDTTEVGKIEPDVVHLVYEVQIHDVLVYVDAYDGEVVGGDAYAS